MTDYMLTVSAVGGWRDVQVNGAGGILEAIALAEAVTGCPVSHGQAGVGSKFDPAVVIDAESGDVATRHDRNAVESIKLAGQKGAAVVRAAMATARQKAAAKAAT